MGGANPQIVKAVLDNIGRRYLVEHAEAEDSSWWYDLYSDGWLVQGGYDDTIDSGDQMWVTLPKEYKDSDYYVNWKSKRRSGGTETYLSQALDKTSSSFKIDDFMNRASRTVWITMGYAA